MRVPAGRRGRQPYSAGGVGTVPQEGGGHCPAGVRWALSRRGTGALSRRGTGAQQAPVGFVEYKSEKCQGFRAVGFRLSSKLRQAQEKGAPLLLQ